jgi:hypothetical protein
MLTRDVRLEGFDTSDWVRLADVVGGGSPKKRERLEPESAAHGPNSEPDVGEFHSKSFSADPAQNGRARGGVIAVTTGQRLRKLLSTRDGRLDIAAEPWPEPLSALARRHAAAWAVELQTGALDELMDRFGQRLSPDQDLLGQMVLFVNVLRELEAEGALNAWPWRSSQWPVPTERLLRRGLDALCPSGKALLLGVFDRGELLTCLAARRKESGFDYLLGPEDLRREMGLVSGDWTRDYRHLARAVEVRLAPLAVGCFGEYDTFRELAADSGAGAWAQAVAARDIIISPVVPALAIPLGIDLGRVAFATLRELAERMGATALLNADSPLLPALERVERWAFFDKDLRRLLGFPPIEVLRKLLARDAGDA